MALSHGCLLILDSHYCDVDKAFVLDTTSSASRSVSSTNPPFGASRQHRGNHFYTKSDEIRSQLMHPRFEMIYFPGNCVFS
jgi:hypothetical protein